MPVGKSAPYLAHEIDYTRNITRELVEQHKHVWQIKGKQLIAAILYGPLAVKEYDENINLLEIVKGYPAGRITQPHEFESTSQFPMYGRLRLQVVSPETFKRAVKTHSPLIDDLRVQKEIIFDYQQFAKKLLR